MQVRLYRGAYQQNPTTYTSCFFDFDGATSGTDYRNLASYAATLPTTGEAVSVISFDIPLAGMDRLTGYDPDPASAQNLAPQPVATVTQSGSTWIVDTLPNAETVTIGSRPEDWDLHYRDQYYTRVSVSYGGATVYVYNPASATYSSSTQYYRSDQSQTLLYTDGQGFFGVSRCIRTYTPVSSTVFAEMAGILRRSGATSGTDATYIWRSGGAAGTQIATYAQTGAATITRQITQPVTVAGTIAGTMLLQLVDFVYADTQYIGIVSITRSLDGIPQSARVSAISMPFWRAEAARPDYGRSSGISYGVGTFSDPSTPVGIPPIPQVLTAVDYGAGMHIRLLSAQVEAGISELSALMAELWSTTDFWSQWRNIRYDPLSAIVALHMIPWMISVERPESSLTIALTRINISNRRPTSRIIDAQVGTVQIPEYYGSRLDYAPHTQAQIYLPFCGDYPLDISDVMGGAVSVTYRIDIATGDTVVFVLGTDRRGLTTISKQYKGNCAYRIPVSGSDNGGAGMMAALSSMVGGTVGMATGNVVGGALQLAGGLGTALTAPIQSTTPQVQGSASAMGVLTPYIKIYRDEQQRPDHYADTIGDTAAIGGTVAYADTYAVTGFTVFDSVDLSGVVATDAEKAEIRSLLQGGVYL